MTGKYDFDTVINRAGSGSVKWDTGKRIFGGSQNFIPMWIADTDFKTLPEISQAMEQRIAHPLFGYATEPNEFFTSFLQWMQERHQLTYEKDWVCPADGVMNAIALAINAFTAPGDRIAVQTPCYDNFYKVIAQNGRVAAENELLRQNGSFFIDVENLEQLFKDGVKALLLCNPHNPTGRVWTKGELKEIATLVKKYDVLVISDEIHSEIVYPGSQYVPLMAVDSTLKDNLITCYSPGKTFNMAAVKSATIIIANEARRKEFKAWQDRMFLLKLNVLSYPASIAAYTHGGEYVDDLCEYLQQNARFVCDYIKDNLPQIQCAMPQGTFLMLWDCTQMGLSGRELVNFFAKNADVAFSGGGAYGKNYSAWVRVNIGCSRQTLEKAMGQIKALL